MAKPFRHLARCEVSERPPGLALGRSTARLINQQQQAAEDRQVLEEMVN